MRDGYLQQIDHPERLYDKPVNQFVAGFIGLPAMNLSEASLRRDGEGWWARQLQAAD